MKEITIPAKDEGYHLNFTVKDSDDVAYDLTDYTVTIKAWASDTPGTPFLETACTKSDPTNGICYYTIGDGKFDTPGTYLGELELTKSGVIESTETFAIIVPDSG